MTKSFEMAALFSNENNPLSPTYLRDDLRKTMESIALMRIFCTIIKQQPRIIIPRDEANTSAGSKVAHIGRHQTNIKRLVDTFNCKINYSLIDIYSDMQDYANAYESYQQVALEIIPEILDADPEKSKTARKEVLEIYDFLKDKAEAIEKRSDIVIGELNVLEKQISEERVQLSKDLDAYLEDIEDGEGTMQQIQEEIEETQRHIKENTGNLVISVIAVAGGGVLVAVGATSSALSAGAATTVAGAGLAVATGGAVKVGEFATSINADNEKLMSLYIKAAQAHVSSVLINELHYHTEALYEATRFAFSSTGNFFGEWHDVATGVETIQEKIEEMEDHSDMAYVMNAIEKARPEWKRTHSYIDTLFYRAKQLKPRVIDDLSDFDALVEEVSFEDAI
ncbi:MAG: HBL/NHE enterotoxin family protein [Bacteroidota bacterium]